MKRLLFLFALLLSTQLANSRDDALPQLHENGFFVIRQMIDLNNKTYSIPSGVSLLFTNGGGFSNGYIKTNGDITIVGALFDDVSLYLYGSLRLDNSVFRCPNKITAIYRSPRGNDSFKSVVIKNSRFIDIGNKVGKQDNSVSAVNLQNVNKVLISKCEFINVGNNETNNTSSIIIGTSASEKEMALSRPNSNIRIEKSSFDGVSTSPSLTHGVGEEHFILIEASDNVVIDNNSFLNNNEVLEYDNEYIYTKCENISITHNTIRGACGGEGFVCCKPFRFSGNSFLAHADIISNDIEGEAFTICTHYGEGKIKKNRLINSYTGFILCLKKTSFINDIDKYNKIVITRNTIVSTATISEIPYNTSTQRSAIFLDCSQEQNRKNKIYFSKNTILVNGTLFPAFINLRDYTDSQFICRNNKVSYSGTSPIRFVYLQSVDKNLTSRDDAILEIKGNKISGFESEVYLPSTSLINDNLIIKTSSRAIIDNR